MTISFENKELYREYANVKTFYKTPVLLSHPTDFQ